MPSSYDMQQDCGDRTNLLLDLGWISPLPSGQVWIRAFFLPLMEAIVYMEHAKGDAWSQRKLRGRNRSFFLCLLRSSVKSNTIHYQVDISFKEQERLTLGSWRVKFPGQGKSNTTIKTLSKYLYWCQELENEAGGSKFVFLIFIFSVLTTDWGFYRLASFHNLQLSDFLWVGALA